MRDPQTLLCQRNPLSSELGTNMPVTARFDTFLSPHPLRNTKRYTMIDPGHCLVFLEGGTHDKKMSKGHLPRVVYHQLYNVYEDKS